MPERSNDQEPQFENPEVEKLEDLTNAEASARERVNRVAEKLAEKSSEDEKRHDEKRPIFSK
ncbi:MAG: hypothetical protein ABSD70_20675 [Terracidiphilus sp.]|jgi:hypothetical protein